MQKTLLREAEKEDIEIVYLPFRGRIKGFYYDKVIAISRHIDTTAEETCILAEELGHYYTSAGNILDQKQLSNRKLERRARAWAYKKLVPLDKLIEAYKAGVRSRFELAEYLQVTEKFLDEALKYYKEKYGMYYRLGKYWICFEPLGILE
ncbi:MAG: ImmA/IrrE family metallo-endopeptidase, partial [Thermoanaerobacteraceae bacterium]|nr:ImmA/IrrE family metallo-endopeptidase [Thermoanaerobacteraceae bacterium]